MALPQQSITNSGSKGSQTVNGMGWAGNKKSVGSVMIQADSKTQKPTVQCSWLVSHARTQERALCRGLIMHHVNEVTHVIWNECTKTIFNKHLHKSFITPFDTGRRPIQPAFSTRRPIQWGTPPMTHSAILIQPAFPWRKACSIRSLCYKAQ